MIFNNMNKKESQIKSLFDRICETKKLDIKSNNNEEKEEISGELDKKTKTIYQNFFSEPKQEMLSIYGSSKIIITNFSEDKYSIALYIKSDKNIDEINKLEEIKEENNRNYMASNLHIEAKNLIKEIQTEQNLEIVSKTITNELENSIEEIINKYAF